MTSPRECPYCAEAIPAEARTCPSCKEAIDDGGAPPARRAIRMDLIVVVALAALGAPVGASSTYGAVLDP